MKKMKYLFLIVGIMVLLASSCTKIEELRDEEAIEELINTNYSVELAFEKEYEDASLILDTIDISNTKEPALIVGWWRKILSVGSNRDIVIERDTAWVTINHHINGLFNIVYYEPDSDTVFTRSKNFRDLVVRKALFVREGDANDPHRGWILKKVSLGEITSKDVPDSALIGESYMAVQHNHIDSIKITYFDTLNNRITKAFTNYLDLINLEEIPIVKSGTEIRFDLYANTPENFAFFYKLATWGTPRRVRMIRDPENRLHFYTVLQIPNNVSRGGFALSIISAPSFRPDNYPYVHHGVLLRVRVK